MLRRSLFIVALATLGCQPDPTDAPRKVAHDFLTAAQYKDTEGMLRAHIDATPRSTYCTSQAFTRLFERARSSRNLDACAEARALTQAPNAPAEAVLFAQILRHVCESERPTCLGYAARVFSSRVPAHPRFRAPLTSFTITNVRVDAGQATAYVDLLWTNDTTPQRFAMRLSQGPQGWRVEHSPFDSSL